MKQRIAISTYESLDEIYEVAAEEIYSDLEGYMHYYGYEPDENGEYDDDYIYEAQHNFADEIIDNEVYFIYDADDLKRWWTYDGWTLDRGYGGPNYKERLLEEKDWDLLFEVLLSSAYDNNGYDDIWKRDVEVNDIVLFGDEDLYDDQDDEDTEEL